MIVVSVNTQDQDDKQTYSKNNAAHHSRLSASLTPSCTDAFLLSCHFVPLSPYGNKTHILQKYNISFLFRPVDDRTSIDLIRLKVPVFWFRSKAPDYTEDNVHTDAVP